MKKSEDVFGHLNYSNYIVFFLSRSRGFLGDDFCGCGIFEGLETPDKKGPSFREFMRR